MTATLLLQIAAKATLVLLGGFALTRAMSRASAAARHLVWVLALAAALAVPVMHAAGPAWTLAILPASSPVLSSSEESASASVAPVVGAPQTAGDVAIAPDRGSVDLALSAETVAELAEPSSLIVPPTVTPAVASEPTPAAPLSWGQLAVRVWLAGVVLMLLRLLMGVTWATMTVRAASELPDTSWQDSLDEAAGALGLTRRIGLRVSVRAAVPMATGLWRAVVLLPPSAIDWPQDRQRVVLQHELAHVKRRDCLVQALAQCACAIHWFNPIAHMAIARLRVEQERACDDMVIQVGTDARAYASHLFEIARSFRATSFPTWVAMSMARPSQLEGRMLAILDEACVRCAPSARVRAALLAATVLIALPFGALRLAAYVTPAADEQSATVSASPSEDHDALVSIDDDTIADHIDDTAVFDPDVQFTSSVEVVYGDVADVDLIELAPSLAFGDAVQAGQHIEGWAVQFKEAAQSFKDVTKEFKRSTLGGGVLKGLPGGVAGGVPGAAQQGSTAVSDETRRRVADALITALNDDNPQVRQEALSALASMRDERAIPGLIRALSDQMTEVRMRALGALVQFESMTAADGVLTALKDRDAQVREMAARHLASVVSRGQLRDQKYVDAFSALLKDENADVREQAVVALGRLRIPSASGPLSQALRDSSADVRQQATRALAQLGSTDAVPTLIPLLKDTAKDVREQAAVALGYLADSRAIDALTAALKDAEPSVREQAARALGQIARGQRRNVRPGAPVPPVPPLPPLPPRVSIDPDDIRDIEDRAREASERGREAAERARDSMLRMRDFERRVGPLNLDVLPVPAPEPAPAPAPPAPPR